MTVRSLSSAIRGAGLYGTDGSPRHLGANVLLVWPIPAISRHGCRSITTRDRSPGRSSEAFFASYWGLEKQKAPTLSGASRSGVEAAFVVAAVGLFLPGWLFLVG